MKPRLVATYILVSLTLFGLGGMLLVLATLIMPLGPGISVLYQKVDLRVMAISLSIWAAGFMAWAIPHPGFKDLGPYTFPKFLLHAAVLVLAQAVGLWIGVAPFFDPVTRPVAWSGIFFASLPSLRSVTGWVLRLFFMSFHRTLTPGVVGGARERKNDGDFYLRGLQCLGICERFGIEPHILLLSLDPVQARETPAHPLVERPLVEQILFLLTENGRIFEPWQYLSDKNTFVSMILLKHQETPEAAASRITRLLGDRLADARGEPLRFSVETRPRPASLGKNLAQYKREDLIQWISASVSEMKPPVPSPIRN